MKKINQGRYQKVYKCNNRVIKRARAERNVFLQLKKIEKYYYEIREKGINVPKYFGFKINEEKNLIETEWEYCGKDLREVLPRLSAIQKNSLVKQIKKFVNLAEDTAFYPIFEQFTVMNDLVYFVDFYPSRTAEDFRFYTKEKKAALKKKFFGKKNRENVIKKEQEKYS